jgi:hypothetical protein
MSHHFCWPRRQIPHPARPQTSHALLSTTGETPNGTRHFLDDLPPTFTIQRGARKSSTNLQQTFKCGASNSIRGRMWLPGIIAVEP